MIAGSTEKLQRVKDGESLEAILNEGKDPLYHLKRLGEVASQGDGTILNDVKSIYETAKYGGKYARHYERYKDEYLARLRRAIKSYKKTIAEHEAWIKNPALKLGDQSHPDFVRRYTEVTWPQDIARNQAYKTIIEGIIEERKNGKAN